MLCVQAPSGVGLRHARGYVVAHTSVHLSATSDAADAHIRAAAARTMHPLITRQLDGIDGSAFTALDVLNELLLSVEQQSLAEQAQVRVLACPARAQGHITIHCRCFVGPAACLVALGTFGYLMRPPPALLPCS